LQEVFNIFSLVKMWKSEIAAPAFLVNTAQRAQIGGFSAVFARKGQQHVLDKACNFVYNYHVLLQSPGDCGQSA